MGMSSGVDRHFATVTTVAAAVSMRLRERVHHGFVDMHIVHTDAEESTESQKTDDRLGDILHVCFIVLCVNINISMIKSQYHVLAHMYTLR